MKPSTARVLERLRFGHATTSDLCQPTIGGVRFGARLQELRDLGYVISREYVRPGSHVYRLLAEPSPTSPAVLSPAGDPPAPLTPPVARAQSSRCAIDDDLDWAA